MATTHTPIKRGSKLRLTPEAIQLYADLLRIRREGTEDDWRTASDLRNHLDQLRGRPQPWLNDIFHVSDERCPWPPGCGGFEDWPAALRVCRRLHPEPHLLRERGSPSLT